MNKSNDILVVTSETVPGKEVIQALGMVRGNSVRTRNLARDVQALGKTIVGGRVGVYGELLEASRTEAIEHMGEEARKLGANAILATRLATSQIMNGAAEVLAYGTAVVLKD